MKSTAGSTITIISSYDGLDISILGKNCIQKFLRRIIFESGRFEDRE
jgi:hypothetical protein